MGKCYAALGDCFGLDPRQRVRRSANYSIPSGDNGSEASAGGRQTSKAESCQQEASVN